jgi:4-hydroxythreonine-4-phosphate dehydrogenase
MPLPRIAISLGDPAGIGPEIALKTLLDPEVRRICRPVLFGDYSVLELQAAACGLQPRLRRALKAADAQWDDETVTLVERRQFSPGELQLGTITASHGESALDSAKAAIDAALAGDVDAVVAAPQTEAAIKLAGIEFDGYPTFVARCTGVRPEDAFLMLCFEHGSGDTRRETRIVHTTLHVSLKHALELITRDRVLNAIRSTDTALRRFGIEAPRIAVSGLNPHAGESGLFGDEERNIIAPAIRDAIANGARAEGPYGADTMFLKQGFDAFVVMVHDQGHIMAKTHAFEGTAALTIGTPVLFSSVAHGSALEIAGKNRASPGALISAIRRLAGVSASRAAA